MFPRNKSSLGRHLQHLARMQATRSARSIKETTYGGSIFAARRLRNESPHRIVEPDSLQIICAWSWEHWFTSQLCKHVLKVGQQRRAERVPACRDSRVATLA
ncbi:hypothetical protein MTO96_020834 [Rhipicephalus appendiculatus]